jgi:hypothetical protein
MDAKAITLTIWAGLGGAAVVAELIGLFLFRPFPTISALFRVVERSKVLRWILLLGWFWLGWHLFVRRGTRPPGRPLP